MARRLAALLAAAALGLSACTNAVAGAPNGEDIGPLTTAEATSAALTSFAESAATHYKGSLVASDGSDFTVDLTATSTGEVFGAITVGGLGATIIVLDKNLYLNGAPAFWAAMAARFGVTSGDGTALGNRWVKLPGVLLGIEFADIFTPDLVSQTAGKPTEGANAKLPTKTNTKIGVEAIEIPVDGGTVYLAKDAPHGVVGLVLDDIGSAENTKAKNLKVTVDDVSENINKIYTDLATQAKNDLGTAVDALTTINQANNRFDACGAASCTLIVDVTNPAKKAVVVHLKADWTGDGAALGSCEATSQPLQPGATTPMSCAITTPGWVSFYQRANSVAGEHPYGAVWTALALADPPDVAGLQERGTAKPAEENKPSGNEQSGHAVYQISYAGGVWKYGVVAARYWRDHARDQLRGCLGVTKSVCTYTLLATSENPVSAYALATKLVGEYVKDKGECPTGQVVSCTK